MKQIEKNLIFLGRINLERFMLGFEIKDNIYEQRNELFQIVFFNLCDTLDPGWRDR